MEKNKKSQASFLMLSTFQHCSGMTYNLDNVGVSLFQFGHFGLKIKPSYLGCCCCCCFREEQTEAKLSLLSAAVTFFLAFMCQIRMSSTILTPFTTSSRPIR